MGPAQRNPPDDDLRCSVDGVPVTRRSLGGAVSKINSHDSDPRRRCQENDTSSATSRAPPLGCPTLFYDLDPGKGGSCIADLHAAIGTFAVATPVRDQIHILTGR